MDLRHQSVLTFTIFLLSYQLLKEKSSPRKSCCLAQPISHWSFFSEFELESRSINSKFTGKFDGPRVSR